MISRVPLLRVRALAKETQLGAPGHLQLHSIFRDVTLDVGVGECIAMVGPRGAGKSTLLYCLAGLLPPSSGTIHWHLPRDSHGRPHGISLAPERPHYYAFLTVRETLDYYAVLHNAPYTERVALVDRVLARLRLTSEAHRSIVKLSHDALQRLTFAQALLSAPRVLLLDETITNLHAMTLAEMRAVVHELTAAGITVIATSCDLRAAEVVASRTLWLVGGTLHERAPRTMAPRTTALRTTLPGTSMFRLPGAQAPLDTSLHTGLRLVAEHRAPWPRPNARDSHDSPGARDTSRDTSKDASS